MTFKIPIKQIRVKPERGRQEFTGILELRDSLERYGLLQPLVVAKGEGTDTYDLIAGERRYRAAVIAGWVEIEVKLLEECSEAERKEIELEENVRRHNLSWPEQSRLFEQIKEIKQRTQGWTNEQVANHIGVSTGHLATHVKMSKKLKERPELLNEVAHLPLHAAEKRLDQIEEAERLGRLNESGLLVFTTEIQHGDCRELIKGLKNESVDLLVTDPPYGLEKMEDLRSAGSIRMSGHAFMSETHNLSREKVFELLKTLAPEFNRVLKPGSHFYIFGPAQYLGHFIELLEPHLEFKPPVLIWDRGKSTTPGYGYNYLGRTEFIIYGQKPPQSRRLNQNKFNVFLHPEVPRDLRVYPTEKPVSLLKEFIEQSSDLNGVVLDPFAGSGSTLVAARECGRRGIGFEVDKEAFVRAQGRLNKTKEGDKT